MRQTLLCPPEITVIIKLGITCSANKKSGKIAGQAKLEENIIELKNSPTLSTITRNIANISGQIQMAEISQKLDIINKKIDLIGEFL